MPEDQVGHCLSARFAQKRDVLVAATDLTTYLRFFLRTIGIPRIVASTSFPFPVTLLPSAAAYIRVYRLLDGGKRLELVHKTTVDGGVAGALCGFKGRLLAGVGPTLRLYDLGKKKLLRKCEYNRWATRRTREDC